MLAQRKGLLYVPVAWKNTPLWNGSIDYEDSRWSLMGNTEVLSWETEYNFSTDFSIFSTLEKRAKS